MMERFLDVSVQRQSLLSSNLANVDTPGYRTVDVDFQNELKSATSRSASVILTSSNHMAAGDSPNRPAPVEVEDLTFRNDLNNVNVDREMGQLSINALKFSMVAQLLAGKFRTLKAAILEGR
jgi:flagellar basal-body rod protein FlgB